MEELAGAIDYPDEIPEPAAATVQARIDDVDAELAALVHSWERGRVLREGIALAIVGPPNAGKSSLLNALLGEERAIVTPVAGTTRDVIEETFVIDDVAVRVLDTAGLRESDDPIERLGVERAERALAGATIALVVVDGSLALDRSALAALERTRERMRIVLFNKRDLGTSGFDARAEHERDAICGSVRDPETIAALRSAIAQLGWHGERLDLTRPHLASARQADAVARAREALAFARATVSGGEPLDGAVPELVAATAALGEITGAAATEAVLDGIFARFCVGK